MIFTLFAGREVHIAKNCDRVHENAAADGTFFKTDVRFTDLPLAGK